MSVGVTRCRTSENSFPVSHTAILTSCGQKILFKSSPPFYKKYKKKKDSIAIRESR